MAELKTIEQEAFQSYVTSTAFKIELSKNQIEALRAIERDELESCKSGFKQYIPRHYGSVRALQRRGFVDASGKRLTKIGELVMRLIEIADIG